MLHEYYALTEKRETTLEEALTQLQNSIQLLEKVLEIRVVPDGEMDQDYVERCEKTLAEVLASQDKVRPSEALRHDSVLLARMHAEKRAGRQDSALHTPWLVTLDRALVAVDRILAGIKPSEQSALFVASWLSSILPITEFSEVKEHLPALSQGWLTLPFVESNALRPQELMDLLAKQAGIEGDARERFVREALRSPLASQLQRAVSRHDQVATMGFFERIATSTIEKLTKDLKERDELIQRLAARLRERMFPPNHADES